MRFGMALIACAVLGGTAAWGTSASKVFDPIAWQRADEVRSVRTSMVDDLLRSGHLQDLTRAETEELLGQPTDTSRYDDWDMVYWLGPERGFISIDSEWLVIQLVNGRVAEARLTRD